MLWASSWYLLRRWMTLFWLKRWGAVYVYKWLLHQKADQQIDTVILSRWQGRFFDELLCISSLWCAKSFLDLWLSSMIWSRLMVAWGLFMVNSLGQYPVQGFFKQTIGENAVCFLQIAIPLMGCIVSAKRVSFSRFESVLITLKLKESYFKKGLC